MERATGIGFWELTVLMVVIASWLLYRYVAPKGWREWTRAGLVQAFIIALYAEMYGFPLTIYVLSGFLGLHIPWLHESGHLWATLFGWGELGAMVEMIIGYAFVFFGIALLIEGWREVYQASRAGRLAEDRLYGVVRHPQYTGIFLALFGQLIHWPTIPTVALFPVIVWAYVRLARREERDMVKRFGERYVEYRRRVPGFFPRRGEWRRLVEMTRVEQWGDEENDR
jgi:protein-S-isoprenylcysteine O-methyltransferase Ste14